MSEFRLILRHAGTVLVGQLAVMAFGVIDTVVAGRHSSTSLAALSVGSAIYMSIFIALMGLLQALLPIWAEHRGAERPLQVGYSWRQGIYLSLVVMVVGTALLLSPGPLLDWTGVPQAMQREVRDYLAILTLALPATAFFRMFGTLNQSMGKPKLVTWLQVFSLFIKLPLTVWLVFGGAGIPAQGAAGCAWATVLVSWLMLALALLLLRTQSIYRPYRIWAPMERPDWRVLAEFLRLGVPGSLAILVEVTSFTLMALFIARLGAVATAGHQVAASVTAVLYMMPLSIGIATSARIGYWLGAAHAERVRGAMKAGFTIALGASVGFSALLWLGRDWLAMAYSSQAPVVAVASALLAWVALYHAADAMQCISVFVLRCYRVTLAPLLIYGVVLWGVGLLGGYVLAYQGLGPWPAMQSPAAFWITGTVALVITSISLAILLWRVAIRPRP